MRKTSLSIFLTAAGLALLPMAASATPPGLDNIRTGFATAVTTGSAEAAVPLANFPLANAVKGEPESLDQAAFTAQFPKLKDYGNCLLTAPFAEDKATPGQYQIDCSGRQFLFGKRQGKWRYVGARNNNE